MSLREFEGKTKKQVLDSIVDMKRELLNLRMQKATGELGNTARFREVRVHVARAYTYLSAMKAGA